MCNSTLRRPLPIAATALLNGYYSGVVGNFLPLVDDYVIQEGVQCPEQPALRLDLALVHYPVSNKNGETIGSAVTNLDLHDIARAGRTFGIDTLYIVTPFADQQALVRDILAHWQTGHGASYNPKRKDALSLVRICSDLAEMYELVEAKWQQRPTVLATSARPNANQLDYAEARRKIFAGEPHLILFGTGWGMTPEVLAEVDALLPPIVGYGEYNHLSVRSAAAIVLDRVLGKY